MERYARRTLTHAPAYYRLQSGRRLLYVIKNVFDKDLGEKFSDFGGLRIGYNGLGYIRAAELDTTD